MTANPVTLENLKRGVNQAFVYLEKKGQSSEGAWDFHNDLYRRLEIQRERGLDDEFWHFLVNELWIWRAIRPKSKLEIREEGRKQFADLQREFHELTGTGGDNLPTIEQIEWNRVAPLFEVARRIKQSGNAMFASKLCHFLVPSAYFITDGTLVKRGWKDYREYWEDCRNEWLQQSRKEILIDELQRRMPIATAPCRTYPWATKIVELCQFDVQEQP